MNDNTIRLDGKVAFITAGANGLGAGTALHIARCGGDVAFVDIDADAGERTAAQVRALGRRALFIEADVLHVSQIEAAVRHAAEQLGRLDILVNNAGGTRQGTFMGQPERSWRKLIDLNFVSMLAATQAAAAVMIEGARGGTIVNIASSEGLRAAPGYAVYAACKAAMVSFTRTMALELSEHRIHVHALAPDMIATAGLKRFTESLRPEVNAARDRYIPLGRMGDVEELTSLVVFLASGMASYLTGVTLPVDGGTLAASGWSRAKDGQPWALYHP
jgi:NAD(P)-dependent dehydrogenase (short-subunit alcohol dehydrogenase family)